MAEGRPDPDQERLAEEPGPPRDEDAALRRREGLLSAIVEANIDASFVKDALGRYLVINTAGARLLGRLPEEVVGRDDTELFDPETARRVMAIDREIIAEGAARTFDEVVTSAGVTRAYRVTKAPYRDEQGRVIGIIGTSRDVTRQKQAEEALLESREFVTRLLDHAPAPIHVTTDDGRARLVNRAWEELFRTRREEVIGLPIRQIFAPEVSAAILDQNREVLETASALSFDDELDAPDGRRSFYTVKFPLRDADGRIEAVGGISLDVTERERAKKSLEESRRRLQALFDTSLDAIWLLDDEARFVDANPAVCSLLGYSREEYLRMGIRDVAFEEDRGLVEGLWRMILERGRLVGEFTQRAKDGSPREVEYRAVAHILPGLHLSVNRDISERKRAERETRTLNAALENAVEGISRIDADGCYAMANPAYAAMLGYRPEELIGRDWRITVHPPFLEVAMQAHRRMRDRGRSEMEILGLRRDGSSFWKQNVKVRVLDPAGRFAGHFCFTKDITERKEAESALRDYSARLEGLSRRLIRAQEDERRHIARELHDEVGQALTAIKLNLRAVLRDPASEAAARRLEESIGLIDRTIGQVRGLSLDLRPSMLDDLGLVDALGSYVSGFAERAGLAARFLVDEAIGRLDPDVETACFRIAQEALTNVARHAGATQVRVLLSRSESDLHLIVADDGAGFVVEEGAGSPGFGILSMRERATLVGGGLEIASTGRGTEVRASFPLGPAGGGTRGG